LAVGTELVDVLVKLTLPLLLESVVVFAEILVMDSVENWVAVMVEVELNLVMDVVVVVVVAVVVVEKEVVVMDSVEKRVAVMVEVALNLVMDVAVVAVVAVVVVEKGAVVVDVGGGGIANTVQLRSFGVVPTQKSLSPILSPLIELSTATVPASSIKKIAR